MVEDNVGAAALVAEGRGIGAEVSRHLAGWGMTVVLGVRSLEKAGDAVRELIEEGADVRARAVDGFDPEGVGRLAADLEDEFGVVDVLVNNAVAYADWTDTALTADLGTARAIFETNLFGAWRMCQAFAPLVRRSAHGRIVNVASGAGSNVDAGFGLTTNRGAVASYDISKAALNVLTSMLAAELEGTGILANPVCPGLTATTPGMEATRVRSLKAPRASSGPPFRATARPAAFPATAGPCPGSRDARNDGRSKRSMKVLGLGWLGIPTERFEPTVAFFRDVMGLEVDHLEEDPAILNLPGGEVVEVFGPSRAGQEQFATGPVVGFRVEEVRGAREEMEAAGVEFIGPVHTGEAGVAWSHFRGPDGKVYEITYRPGSQEE